MGISIIFVNNFRYNLAMNSDKIIELLMYAVPSLITGGVAYYLFDNYLMNLNKKVIFYIFQKYQFVHIYIQ